MKKYVVEFIGTFFLVLAVCMSVAGGLGNWAPLTIGVMLSVMVYAGWHISGAHFNPAITLAVYLRGKFALGELPAYFFAQVIGGIVAALLSGYLLRGAGIVAGEPLIAQTGPALLAEFLGAFVVCYVFLHVTMSKNVVNNVYYGVAIGGAMMTSAYMFRGISVGAFNPAIAAGATTAHIIAWSALWVYVVATMVAGALAAFVFNYVNGPE